MYGKIFESIYDGSLHGNWEAIVTLEQLIVLADENGIVDKTLEAISNRTSIPLKYIKKGIAVLESPDPYSRTPGNDGRRIELLDDHKPWGWVILNYEKYRKLASYDDKKKADRERIANKRKSDKKQ